MSFDGNVWPKGAPPAAPPLPSSISYTAPHRKVSPPSNSPKRIKIPQYSEAQDPNDIVEAAAYAIAKCLNSSTIHWAIVGGASCSLLGSMRTTRDVDFVVARPESVREAKNLLRADTRFSVDRRTRHTHFHYPGHQLLEIDVLCWPSTFKLPFEPTTPVLDMNGVHILALQVLFNSKCGSVTERSSEIKRDTDSLDICFILRFARERGIIFAPKEVYNATPRLKEWLEARESGFIELFSDVGL